MMGRGARRAPQNSARRRAHVLMRNVLRISPGIMQIVRRRFSLGSPSSPPSAPAVIDTLRLAKLKRATFIRIVCTYMWMIAS
jgi:hypothetical protein